jgi:hypothetical protein
MSVPAEAQTCLAKGATRFMLRGKVRREVGELLRDHRYLSRFPMVSKWRRRLGLAETHYLIHKAHHGECVAFVASKAINDPALAATALGAEALIFTGRRTVEGHLMQRTLTIAHRHYPLYRSPLSSRALCWMHARLARQVKRGGKRYRPGKNERKRYKKWLLLKDIEAELRTRTERQQP